MRCKKIAEQTHCLDCLHLIRLSRPEIWVEIRIFLVLQGRTVMPILAILVRMKSHIHCILIMKAPTEEVSGGHYPSCNEHRHLNLTGKVAYLHNNVIQTLVAATILAENV
jgi:hypothetical protein